MYVHILRPKVPQKLKILKKIIISELLKSIRNCYQQLPFTEKYAVDVDSCTFLGQLQAALFITPNTYFTVLSIQTEGYVWSNVICTSHCTPNYRLQVWKRKSTTLKSALCPSAISRVPNWNFTMVLKYFLQYQIPLRLRLCGLRRQALISRVNIAQVICIAVFTLYNNYIIM